MNHELALDPTVKGFSPTRLYPTSDPKSPRLSAALLTNWLKVRVPASPSSCLILCYNGSQKVRATFTYLGLLVYYKNTTQEQPDRGDAKGQV